jgi:dolichol-phosphate mannosyltransferase
MRLLIATTTYNEADSIIPLIDGVRKYMGTVDLLIIDDNSPDGTAEIVRQRQQIDPALKLIVRPGKLGIGSAHTLALMYARDCDYDGLITMDADLSHAPRDLPTIRVLLNDYDFVIGSRYIEGGSCEYGIIRTTLSYTANLLARKLLKLPLKESTTSFRGFSKHILNTLSISRLNSSDYGFFAQAVYEVTRITDKLCEFPIYFSDRRHGTTKISKKSIFSAAYTIFKLGFKRILSVERFNIPVDKDELVHACKICGSKYYQKVFDSRESVSIHDQIVRTAGVARQNAHGQIVKCLECGIVCTNPLPAVDGRNLHDGYIDDVLYRDDIIARKKTSVYLLNKLSDLLPGKGKLLDIGCRYGDFLAVASKVGYVTYGIESSREAALYAVERKVGLVHQGTIGHAPFKTEEFDVITAFNVLEHLHDPVFELRTIYQLLAPKGIFCFSTLNVANWFPWIMGEKWSCYSDANLYYFNIQTVTLLLERCGFAILRVCPYRHFVSCNHLLGKTASVVQFSYLKYLLDNFCEKTKAIHLPVQFGDTQLFVCRKID